MKVNVREPSAQIIDDGHRTPRESKRRDKCEPIKPAHQLPTHASIYPPSIKAVFEFIPILHLHRGLDVEFIVEVGEVDVILVFAL